MKDYQAAQKRNRYASPNKINLGRTFALLFVIAAVLMVGFVSVPYLYGTESDGIVVESTVGSDLMLQPNGIDSPKSSYAAYRDPDRPTFPRLDRSRISSITPAQIQHIKPFNPEGSLEFLRHTVESGESLWSIARRYDRELHSIASANYDTLTRHRHLQVGTQLKIPNRDGVLHEVERGESLASIQSTYGVPAADIREFNELEGTNLHAGQELFIPGASPQHPHKYSGLIGGDPGFGWPVDPDYRRITSRFGNRYHPVYERVIFHAGVDIGAPPGAAVYASERGRVIEAGRMGGYGLTVDIQHPNGYVTRYAHLSSYTVSRGQNVNKRSLIGRVGQTGVATGPHLHFEILENGSNPVNPLNRLP